MSGRVTTGVLGAPAARVSGLMAGGQTAAGGFKLLALRLVATLLHPILADRLR